jgi:hypothetical protein
MQHGVNSLKIRKFLPLFPADRRPMVVLVANLLTLAATGNLPLTGEPEKASTASGLTDAILTDSPIELANRHRRGKPIVADLGCGVIDQPALAEADQTQDVGQKKYSAKAMRTFVAVGLLAPEREFLIANTEATSPISHQDNRFAKGSVRLAGVVSEGERIINSRKKINRSQKTTVCSDLSAETPSTSRPASPLIELMHRHVQSDRDAKLRRPPAKPA